jgi:hypothetical protein
LSQHVCAPKRDLPAGLILPGALLPALLIRGFGDQAEASGAGDNVRGCLEVPTAEGRVTKSSVILQEFAAARLGASHEELDHPTSPAPAKRALVGAEASLAPRIGKGSFPP